MLAGGLVGHAVTAVLAGHVPSAMSPGVHGFRPGAAVVGVVVALLVLVRHHLLERHSSNVVHLRVVVGQQVVLLTILALEWATVGHLEQIAHDPWLWVGGAAQLMLVGAWRLLERAAMTMADRVVGFLSVQGCGVARVSRAVARRPGTRSALVGASTRAPPGRTVLLGPAG